MQAKSKPNARYRHARCMLSASNWLARCMPNASARHEKQAETTPDAGQKQAKSKLKSCLNAG